ncbi:hypothetical protein CRV24_006962 [Beauveria bassiana]|nr:hypothetical protein CRV24_006962 [Beauveria bassiana]
MPLKNPSLAALQQSRSRFCEGSMNDRASAAPPVHFLGPDALAALEQPASNPRPSHETSSSSSSSGGGACRLTAAPIDVPGATAAGFQFTGFQSARPSREEVLASYQQLMAGGFFQANAIPSSRHGRPGTSLPARPATSHHQPPPPPPPPPSSSPPPQWPLTTPHHHQHHQGFASCPVQSPTSVSSRGTKRAAAPDSDSDESMHDDGDSSSSYKENQAPPHPNTVHDDRQPKKRLRRLPSRESLFVPKIRGSSSSSSSATSSTAAATSSSFRRRLTPAYGVPPANKLQKRRPQPQSQPQWQGSSSSSRSGVAAVRPRHVSDGGGSARVLRGCAAEAHRPMRVVPDEGRGIPSVPVIPARFTFGEDRQNNGPWRGLRVR